MPEPETKATEGCFTGETSESQPFDFFERNTEERAEMIEGLIRERQLCAYAGPYGMGKSPSLIDITVHRLNGIPWCCRRVEKGPVIVLDFESTGSVYKQNLKSICRRLGVQLPRVPEELEIYLEQDTPSEPTTGKLLSVLESNPKNRILFLQELLARKSDALLIIDPLELLFRINTGRKENILGLYHELKLLLSRHPKAAILLTFNLRKKDRKAKPPDLFTNPRGWLEKVCGSLDILNRSDVRLGLDVLRHDEEKKVINGIRRGEDMHPIILRSVANAQDELAGFESCDLDRLDFMGAFTSSQQEHWAKLPVRFRFDEVADKIVPRASLSRLIKRAKLLRILALEDGIYRKQGAGSDET